MDTDSYSCIPIRTMYVAVCAYSSTRVIPGPGNAAAQFQSSVEPLFMELRAHLKALTDELNIHTKDVDTLVANLRGGLEI